MNTIYVLIMIFSGNSPYGGVATLTAEFNSKEACETAMRATATAHSPYSSILRMQGCFRK